MIKSKSFWAAAILLAVIPLLVMDIPKHYMDWTKEVHDEIITTVYNQYQLSNKEKAVVLTNILDSNTRLMAMMYIKGFLGAVLLFFSFYFFALYRKKNNVFFWEACTITLLLLLCSVSLKLYSWSRISGDEKIKLLTLSAADTTLGNIYNTNFKGKVVYVDFWGTTCGPCLEEFRNFTRPLKEKYRGRNDIAYLYICGGHQLVWKQQLEKYEIEGSHIFLNSKEYAQLFRRSVKGSKDTIVAMPRYLIMDKQGTIVDTYAPRPSDKDSISAKLDKYLAFK